MPMLLAMVPRRRTDQVYAKLQQVQRRISESGGGPAPAVGAPRPSTQPGTGQVRRSAPSVPQGGEPEAPPLLPPGAGRDTWAVTISAQLLSLLVLVALLAMGAMFYVGIEMGARRGGAGMDAPRIVAAPELPEAPPQLAGRSIIILKQVARPSATDQAKLRSEVDALNATARKAGWKPWFDLRQPSSGELQVIYGMADGQLGIDRAQFADLFSKLSKGRYPGSRWLDIR